MDLPLDNPAVVAALALGALTLLLALARAARIRKSRRIIASPAREAKGVRSLPEDLKLDTDAPLFDVLYANFRLKPKLHVARSPKTGEPSLLPELERDTDDDQANRLIDLGHYHQTPGYLPTDTVAASVLKNLVPVVKGKKSLKRGVEHAVLDSLGPGGGLAGAKAGEALGLAAAPFLAGLAVYALPALMVAGAWAGSLAGRKVGARVKARRVFAAMRKAHAAAKDFKRKFVGSFPSLMRQLEREHDARATSTRRFYRVRQGWLARALFPDLMSVFLKECLHRLEHDRREELRAWRQVLKEARRLRPADFVVTMAQLSGGRFFEDPALLQRYEAVRSAMRELEDAKVSAAAA